MFPAMRQPMGEEALAACLLLLAEWSHSWVVENIFEEDCGRLPENVWRGLCTLLSTSTCAPSEPNCETSAVSTLFPPAIEINNEPKNWNNKNDEIKSSEQKKPDFLVWVKFADFLLLLGAEQIIWLSTAMPTTRGRRFSFPSRAPDEQLHSWKLDLASTHLSRVGIPWNHADHHRQPIRSEPPPASGKHSSKTSPESEARSSTTLAATNIAPPRKVWKMIFLLDGVGYVGFRRAILLTVQVSITLPFH